jgi:hypothetical protein
MVIAVIIARLYRKSTDAWHEIFTEGKENKAVYPLTHNGKFSSCSGFIIEWKIKFSGPHQLILSPSSAFREPLITRHLATLHVQRDDKCKAEVTASTTFPGDGRKRYT